MPDTPHTSIEQPRRFRKKPVEVEAIRVAEIVDSVGAEHECLLPQWVLDAMVLDPETDEGFGAKARLHTLPRSRAAVIVRTKQGQEVVAEADEWIACAAPDDLWPVDADIFEATYEPAEQDLPALSLGRDALQQALDFCRGSAAEYGPGDPHYTAYNNARIFIERLAKNLGDGGQGEAARLREALERIANPESFYDGPGDHQDRLSWVCSIAEVALGSTQPVPSCLSEEGVREKLLGEEMVEMLARRRCEGVGLLRAAALKQETPEARTTIALGNLNRVLSEAADFATPERIEETVRFWLSTKAVEHASAARENADEYATALAKELGVDWSPPSPQQPVPDTGEAQKRRQVLEDAKPLIAHALLNPEQFVERRSVPDLPEGQDEPDEETNYFPEADCSFYMHAIVTALGIDGEPDPPGEGGGGGAPWLRL